MGKNVAKLGNFRQFLVVDCCGGVLDGTGYILLEVYNYVFGSDLWLGEVVVEYLDGVGDDY